VASPSILYWLCRRLRLKTGNHRTVLCQDVRHRCARAMRADHAFEKGATDEEEDRWFGDRAAVHAVSSGVHLPAFHRPLLRLRMPRVRADSERPSYGGGSEGPSSESRGQNQQGRAAAYEARQLTRLAQPERHPEQRRQILPSGVRGFFFLFTGVVRLVRGDHFFGNFRRHEIVV
jgi:hypothetical protein